MLKCQTKCTIWRVIAMLSAQVNFSPCLSTHNSIVDRIANSEVEILALATAGTD